MIDTDKYEGHTPAPWDVREAGINRIMVYTDNEDFAYEEVNRNLVADAPLLLEAYKELREALAYTASLLTCRIEGDDIPLIHIREYALDVVDMTVDEAMGTTDLMGDEEE